MMATYRRLGAGLALGLLLSSAAAQAPEQRDEEPTLEERVTALEREVASLDTILEAHTTARPEAAVDFERHAALARRVGELERALSVLRGDFQRLETLATAALRTAGEAQRTAAIAERVARDAARRVP